MSNSERFWPLPTRSLRKVEMNQRLQYQGTNEDNPPAARADEVTLVFQAKWLPPRSLQLL
jgi:hypothetical protein